MKGIKFATTYRGDVEIDAGRRSYAVVAPNGDGRWVVFPLTRGSNHYDDSMRANRVRSSFLATVRLAVWFAKDF